MVDNLVNAGYYVVAIDYYGHGQTNIPIHDVSLYHVADDIKYLMNTMGIKKAVIGGWSRGGYISTAFYDSYPESTLGLILEDGGSVATNTHYHSLQPDSLIKLIESFEVEKYITADTTFNSRFEAYCSIYDGSTKGAQFHLLAYLKKIQSEKWAVNPGLFKLLHHSSTKKILDTILRPSHCPPFTSSLSNLDPKIILRKLNVPVLVLDPTSKDDLFPFEKENAALKSSHPNLIEHAIYENTGHNIHYEKAKDFVGDLSDFLTKIKEFHNL